MAKRFALGAAIPVVAAVVAGTLVFTGDDDPQPDPGDEPASPSALPEVDVRELDDARLIDPIDLVLAPDGALYVVEQGANRVARVDLDGGTVGTVAGTGLFALDGPAGDGGPATEADLAGPTGIGLGDDGSLYLAEPFTGLVRRVAPDGTLSTVAGNGLVGEAEDGDAAIESSLSPLDVAVAEDGTVYVVDGTTNRLWAIDSEGELRGVTAASGGEELPQGDADADAADVSLPSPNSVAIDGAGDLVVSDETGAIVRIHADGRLSTLVPSAGSSDDESDESDDPRPFAPDGLAITGDGGVVVADPGAQQVFAIDAEGTIELLAGTGTPGFSGDDEGPAVDADLGNPRSVAVLDDGTVLFVESFNDRIRAIDADGTITTVAGRGEPGNRGDNDLAVEAPVTGPTGIAVGPDGAVYVAEWFGQLRRVDPDGTVTSVGGAGGAAVVNGGDAYGADFSGVEGVSVAADGRIALADPITARVLIVDAGRVSIAAGGNGAGFAGDGGPASAAQVDLPRSLVWRGESLIVADGGNFRLRSIAPDGTITTVAGDGNPAGASLNPGPALAANLAQPVGLAVADDGTTYVCEALGHRVRRIDPDGTISVVAGTGEPGSDGDGGPAVDARLSNPTGAALDSQGRLYVAETDGHRVRRIDPDGTITTVAGTGAAGSDGVGGPAEEAELDSPWYIAVGPDDSLYISDTGNDRVLRVDPESGEISHFLGLS